MSRSREIQTRGANTGEYNLSDFSIVTSHGALLDFTLLLGTTTITTDTFTRCVRSEVTGPAKLDALINFCDTNHPGGVSAEFYISLALYTILNHKIEPLRVLIEKKGFNPAFRDSYGTGLNNSCKN